MQFNEDLKMVLPELKVVRGTRTDPLFIVGSDMMAPSILVLGTSSTLVLIPTTSEE